MGVQQRATASFGGANAHTIPILKAISETPNKMTPWPVTRHCRCLNKSLYVATTPEALKNYHENEARTWYKSGVEPDDPAILGLAGVWRDNKVGVFINRTPIPSLLRPVAQEWAATSPNIDYFPNYEMVQNSNRAPVREPDRRHVRGAGAQHIIELFLENYLERDPP